MLEFNATSFAWFVSFMLSCLVLYLLFQQRELQQKYTDTWHVLDDSRDFAREMNVLESDLAQSTSSDKINALAIMRNLDDVSMFSGAYKARTINGILIGWQHDKTVGIYIKKAAAHTLRTSTQDIINQAMQFCRSDIVVEAERINKLVETIISNTKVG